MPKLLHLTFNFKIRSLQLINHVLMIAGLYLAAQHDQLNLLWVSLLFYVLLGPMGVHVGLHRLFSHRSFKTTKFWERFLSIVSIYSTLGSTIAWVGVHRLHHDTSDKPGDPHSPYINNNQPTQRKFNCWQAFKSWIGLWGTFAPILPRHVNDLIRDPFHQLIHKHYFKIIIATCILLAIVDPWLVLFVYIIPACLAFHAASSVGVISHRFGYRLYETTDESRNSWVVSLVTLGDGWHNTHHARPGKWYCGEKWWELDPCGEFIKLIKKN